VYTQRTKRPQQSFRSTGRWWVPVVQDAGGGRMPVDPQPDDAYVVVDEVLEERVRLVVAPWPRLDRDGRLLFEDLGRPRGPYAPTTLQALVDRHRARQGQVQRPLRVGDAFLVRGDARRLAGWDLVVDVTQAARAAAKLAVARAVTHSPEVERQRPGRGRPGAELAAGPQAAAPPARAAGAVALPTV
jgi:hypothetical protein